MHGNKRIDKIKNIWLYLAIILKILNFPILVYQFSTFPIKMPIRLYET